MTAGYLFCFITVKSFALSCKIKFIKKSPQLSAPLFANPLDGIILNLYYPLPAEKRGSVLPETKAITLIGIELAIVSDQL